MIQSAVANEAFGDADALAQAWAQRERADPRPYCWRVVLAEDDAERAGAAEWALRSAPDGPHAELLRAALDALGIAALPSGSLVQLDASSDLAGWPVWLDDEGGTHETPPPASGREALDEVSPPLAPLKVDPGHQDGDYAFGDLLTDSTAGADQPLAPLKVDPGHQDGDHALNGLLADLAASAAGVDDPLAPLKVDPGHQDRDHAAGALSADVAAATVATDPLAFMKVDSGHQDGDHALNGLLADLAPSAARADDPLAPMKVDSGHQDRDHALIDLPPATEELDDMAIRAAWLGGASVPELIARLTDASVPAAIARARVRGAISSRPAAPVAEVVAQLSPTPVVAMNGAPMPFLEATELNDEAIWQRWQAGEKTDDLVLVLCGRRRGTKADAARDRIYAVVVPRIVADLDASDLVERLLASDDIPNNPRYPILMQRLARSETPPIGALEQSLRKRLAAARQEV